ncbi:SMR family transporter [Nocardia sp. NPDC050712]|uniref:DMT family transporter n=1 Tax=Nocardia sp. NPDC050712 TaxID=3155518 RepID=UPI0033D9002F
MHTKVAEWRRAGPNGACGGGPGGSLTVGRMAWILLVVSGFMETAWAVALERSEGFSKVVPSVIFAVALALSMAGLGIALREIPVGTGYAVWVGIGAVGTAVIGMLFLGESHALPRILCLLLIVCGVVGLKLFS